LNRGPLTLVVSALPPELWPPGDSQPSQFSISLCVCRCTCMSSGKEAFLAPGCPVLCANVKPARSHPVTW